KIDSLGNLEWQKCLGGNDIDVAGSVRVAQDGGYIIAASTRSNNGDVSDTHGGADAWVIKLDINGNLQWQKCFGGSGDEFTESIRNTSDGGYIFAGGCTSSDGDVSGNHGDQDSWVVKLDSLGNIEWQKSLGGSSSDGSAEIETTIDGGYIVSSTSFSNDSDVLDHHGFNTFSDCWIVKLDGIGNIEWSKSLGGTNPDIGGNDRSILPEIDGSFVVIMTTMSTNGDVTFNHGLEDYWLVKLDQLGSILWNKSFGGSQSDYAYAVALAPTGGYILSGTSNSTDGDITNSLGNIDYWMINTDTAGTLIWQKSYGGSKGESYGNAIPTTDGQIILSGNSNSSNGDVSGQQGKGDYWIVKLNGEILTTIENIDSLFSFSLTPNPATNFITIQIQLQSGSSFITTTITNLLGEIVFEKTSPCLNGNLHEEISLDENFPQGMYVVKVSTPRHQWVKPLIILK
ncbi:MAG: T9SS type A sorting domain-containing protein, partial [Chitinophagales bacterium]